MSNTFYILARISFIFLLSLWSVVLRIACGLTAFILQYNVVCLDVPFHVCPSVVGVCHGIGNGIDKLHLGIVRIVLDRDFRWDRYLYRAFLLTAFQVVGSTLDFFAGRPVLIFYTHLMSKGREFQNTEKAICKAKEPEE